MNEPKELAMLWALLEAAGILSREEITKAFGAGTAKTVEPKPDYAFRDLLDTLEATLARNEAKIIPVTMLDMDAICEDVAQKVSDLFAAKNEQYAKTDDVLKAFRDGAERRYGEVNKKTMLACLCAYKDKHDLALLQHGADLDDAEERLLDIIIYSLLGIAILRTQ